MNKNYEISYIFSSDISDNDYLRQELLKLIDSYHGSDRGVYYKIFLRNIDNNLSISNLLLSLEICRQVNEFTIYALSDTLYSLFVDNKVLYEEIYNIHNGIYKEVMNNNLLLKNFNQYENPTQQQYNVEEIDSLKQFYQFHSRSYCIAV